MIKKASTKKRKQIEFTKDKIVIRKTPLVYAITAVVLVALLVAATFGVYKLSVNANNKMRLGKIIDIYDSLQLNNDYRMVKTNIFGDKRVYEWDKGRTFASEVTLVHAAAPTEVRAQLRKQVEAAGFTFVQTEYEGSISPIDQFKNSQGNYVRVGVMSKYAQDKYTYGDYDLNDPLANHKDEAPSYISVKVNLDDNNE